MLAGCQSQPKVAAYVGTTQITIDQVNQIVGEIDKAGRQPIPDAQYGNARQFVLARLVLLNVIERYAHDNNIDPPAVQLDVTAQRTQLPMSARFVSLLAQSDAYLGMMAARSAPSQPTDRDLHDIFDLLLHPGVTYDQLKPQIQQLQGLPEALGVRDRLRQLVGTYHVVINPEYRGTVVVLPGEPIAPDGSSLNVVLLKLDDSISAGSGFVSS